MTEPKRKKERDPSKRVTREFVNSRYRKHAVWNIFLESRNNGHRVIPEWIENTNTWRDPDNLKSQALETYVGECVYCDARWSIMVTEDESGKIVHSFSSRNESMCPGEST